MATDNQKRDYNKFFNKDNDASFVKRHNDNLINEVINESYATRLKKAKIYEDKLGERSDAVATYLKAIQRGKTANVDKYFGKKALAHLRGQKIIETIKGEMRQLQDITNL
jgi:hypothetical protein